MGGGSLSKNFPLHSNTMFFSRFFASSVVICSDLVSGGWTGYMPWWVGLYYMFSHFLTFNMLNNCRYFNHFLRGSLIELIIRSLFKIYRIGVRVVIVASPENTPTPFPYSQRPHGHRSLRISSQNRKKERNRFSLFNRDPLIIYYLPRTI